MMVRAVDHDAHIRLFWRDGPHFPPDRFDRSVICGMPLLWSNGTSSTIDHPSWPPLAGWLSESRNIAMAGVGSYLIRRGDGWGMDPVVADTVKRVLIERCRFAYARDAVTSKFTGIPAMACPSVLAGKDLPRGRDRRLTNLMPTLAHYPQLTPREANIWGRLVRPISEMLKARGFLFVAHNEPEASFARELGWPEDRLFVYQRTEESLYDLLRVYSRASHYVGNRIHGAIVSRSFGAATLCIGSDSRLEAVRQVGGETLIPANPLVLQWLPRWIARGQSPPFPVAREYENQLRLFKTLV